MRTENTIFRVINQDNGVILADNLKMARTMKSRCVGLLNRNSLNPGEALLIEPCSSIHTFFMRFSIDVIFLDADGKAIKIVRGLKPWHLAGCFFGAHMVIEFSAEALTNKIKEGNAIKIEQINIK